jgi:Asp-tRNA(Asn)/Glu-tRNA(Gln) amidotransferase A subunit family amidase
MLFANIFNFYVILLKIAKASTQRYAEKKPLSFLDGVPVGFKEEFDVVRIKSQ